MEFTSLDSRVRDSTGLDNQLDSQLDQERYLHKRVKPNRVSTNSVSIDLENTEHNEAEGSQESLDRNESEELDM